jgi:hypothetical protein
LRFLEETTVPFTDVERGCEFLEIDGRKPLFGGHILCVIKLSADVPQQEVRMKIQQLYADVTANIVKELEAGAVPWLKSWKGRSTGLLPANAVSKRTYSGINIPILWFAATDRGYEKHQWLAA